jgi:hypothetical protein
MVRMKMRDKYPLWPAFQEFLLADIKKQAIIYENARVLEIPRGRLLDVSSCSENS